MHIHEKKTLHQRKRTLLNNASFDSKNQNSNRSIQQNEESIEGDQNFAFPRTNKGSTSSRNMNVNAPQSAPRFKNSSTVKMKNTITSPNKVPVVSVY
jgi:hypothetical protein